MRKIKLYIAISLNGKIARHDGSVDWLESIPNPDKIDHGYFDFIKTIDTTIQGYKTYAQLLAWDIPFPYPTKHNYVFTRKSGLEHTKNVEFISEDHIDFVRTLKKRPGKDIWLIGGGQINTLLFNAGLIDEMQIFVMPIIIPGGLELFAEVPEEMALHLIETKNYPTGAVELKYEIRG